MLPLLEDVLGGGVAEALARTATALREDTELIDTLAAQALPEVKAGSGLQARALAALPDPVRRRVIRGWLLAGGATGLTDKQIRGVDTLVTAWRGQGGVAVGSPLRGERLIAGRHDGVLTLRAASLCKSGLPLVVRPLAWHAVGVAQISSAITPAQPVDLYPGDIKSVLLTAEQIQARIAELGEQIGNDYRDVAAETGQDLLLITVLKGAVIFVTDLARAIPVPTQFEFMAVSSYGSSTSSSGVVRILKDLDRDINDRDVLIVEDVVDSGLTLSWLLRNLTSRHPRSLRVCTLLRKPDAMRRQRRHRLRAASTFPTTSSWATAWITTSATATCRISGPWIPGSTRSRRALVQLPHRGHREADCLLAGFQRDCGGHAIAAPAVFRPLGVLPVASEMESTLPSRSPDSCAYWSARFLASLNARARASFTSCESSAME